MRIAVSGATGLVGSSLLPVLQSEKHQVTPLVRPGAGDRGIVWDPATGVKDPSALEGFDAVVHLAGESIATGRWNPEKKARIRDSRVKGTRMISAALTSLVSPPRVLVCASAIGYYGDRDKALLDEQAAPGEGFLSEVCREWEGAASSARDRGIRVVNLRIGIILSPRGGALAKMLFPFRMGLGGRIGDGRQYMSWVAIDDLIAIIGHALTHDSLGGPVNAVAPGAVTNAEFTAILARVLSRPAIFPMPAFAARLAFGEMADALLLASTRVVPRRLEESGFRFRSPDLDGALRHLLR